MNNENSESIPESRAGRLTREQPTRGRKPIAMVVLVAGIAILVLSVVALLQQQDSNDGPEAFDAAFTGGPRLAVDQTLIDHGDVPYGHTVEAEYRLKNVGDQLLRINDPEVKILDGCCPSEAIVGQTTLQPGEETTLSLMFRMHEGTGGPHEFEILVPTNDVVESATTVRVAATYPEP